MELWEFITIFVVEKREVMYYIYEKNLATGKVRLYETVPNKEAARAKVKDMNGMSLFEDKFYYIKTEPENL